MFVYDFEINVNVDSNSFMLFLHDANTMKNLYIYGYEY